MAAAEDEFLLPPRSILVLQEPAALCPSGVCRGHTRCQSHISPSQTGAGRSGAGGEGGHSGSTCSAPGSTSLPRCSPCRWQQHLWGHRQGGSALATTACGSGGPAAPMGALSYLPQPPPAAPPARWPLSWCPQFQPTGPREGCADLEGAEAVDDCPVPTVAAPQKGSTPHAHLVRWHRCEPPSPSPGPSSRCRAVSLSAHRGARPCGWPGSLSAAWQQLQHLEVGTALSGPLGTRDRDPALTCDLCPAHPG